MTKTIVYDRDFEELEIKPSDLIKHYRRLLDQEVHDRLATAGSLHIRNCPGCQANMGQSVFEKSGLTYVECPRCQTVYASPCPSDEDLIHFYREAKAPRFWREHFYQQTKAMRRRKIYQPQASWTLTVLDRFRPHPALGIDLGYHSRLFFETLAAQEKGLFAIVAANPVADIECADLTLNAVTVRPTPLAEFSTLGPADIIFMFEVLDRYADVEALFSAISDVLAPGGLVLTSTTSISGFDLQVLWDRSESIYPPDRLNLLSTEGLTQLASRHGFEILEFSTPGMFDVDVVRRALKRNEDVPCSRFVRYLLQNRNEQALHEFQAYLQQNRLSSFARLVLRKE